MSLSAYTPSPTIRLGALFSIIVALKKKNQYLSLTSDSLTGRGRGGGSGF